MNWQSAPDPQDFFKRCALPDEHWPELGAHFSLTEREVDVLRCLLAGLKEGAT